MKFIKKEHLLVPTKEVLNEIQKSIACKQPEQLAMLGSSDGKYIDIMFFIDKSKSTQTSCEPDIEVCNKKIREWYEKDIAWFTDHGIDGETKAYMQLVSGIAKRAKMLTRVTATESVSENDKFTMRLFLVSLNFKGTEYAFARKFLIRNLTGNSGWRTEEAKARHDARKARTEIEAPEVTIGQSSEGGEADAGISE